MSRLPRGEVPKGAYELGKMHAKGHGVVQDWKEAKKWYESAAEDENSEAASRAAFELAETHARGHGGAQDLSEAVKWYKLGDKLGNASAQCALGIMHSDGKGVKQDDFLAVKLFRRAARQNFPEAQLRMAVACHNGEGHPQDYQEACKWYKLAGKNGHGEASYHLGRLYGWSQEIAPDLVLAHAWLNLAATLKFDGAEAERDNLVRKMTRDQVAKAQKYATRIFNGIKSLVSE